jgi:hypothetical protein
MLPRVLGLLSFDDVGGVVSRALAAASDMPLAVWLPHLPSLLSSLQRPEQRIVKPLLIQLGLNFPQVWQILNLPTLLIRYCHLYRQALKLFRCQALESSRGTLHVWCS